MAEDPPHRSAASQPAPRGLEVRTPPGRIRGVYTARPIEAGEVVEVAPIILVDAAASLLLDQTPLSSYYFHWGEDGSRGAVALGYAMLYNHTRSPNLDFRYDYAAETIVFTALRDIAPGEQLTINYRGLPDDGCPVWFEPDPDI